MEISNSKKEMSEWLSASILFVGAGLIVPFGIGYILIPILLSDSINLGASTKSLVGMIITYFGIYGSTKLISNFLLNQYFPGNTKKVALIALFLFGIITVPYSLYTMKGVTDSAPGADVVFYFHALVLCVFASALYKGVKRFYK